MIKKVLFIASLYYPHVGGIETMIAELSRFYRGQKIDSIVLTKKWPSSLPNYEEYEGTEIHRVISARTEEEFLSLVDWLKVNNHRIKADVIHIVGVRRPLPLVGLMLGKLWNVPVISTIAGGEIPDQHDPQPGIVWNEGKEFIPDVLRRSNCVTCVSDALGRDLGLLLPDLKSTTTLYAGVDFSVIKEAKPEQIRKKFILSLRRLDPSKGIDILIKAFNLIKHRFRDLDLVISGEGSEEFKLRALVDECDLNDRVVFTGTVSLKRAISLLKGAVATVVPSLSEGGGLINVEAQAAGCPVIASRVGGIPEYVKEGVSGILFESGNHEELAEKLSQVSSDDGLRRAIIAGGYEHAKSFDWNVLAPQYLDLYLKTINEYKNTASFEPWSDLTRKLWVKLKN